MKVEGCGFRVLGFGAHLRVEGDAVAGQRDALRDWHREHLVWGFGVRG